MRIDVRQYAPLGIDYRQELRWIGGGLAVGMLYSMGFLLRLMGQYEGLFAPGYGTNRTLLPGAFMPDFADLLDGSLLGFLIIALCMAVLAVYHYLYHYQGSRSIYLMRRLPSRRELWKRCLAIPALSAVLALLAAVLIMALYFGIYLLVTPEECLLPGQLARLWNVYLGV